MIDIPSLPSLLSSLGVVQPVASVPSLVNILANISTNISNLPAGTLLAGTIISKDINGQVQVETPNGTLSLRSIIPLEEGSQVHFKVTQSGPLFSAQLVSINNKTITRDTLESLLLQDHPALANVKP